MTATVVDVGSYAVLVGHDLLDHVATILGPDVLRVALICPEPMLEPAEALGERLGRAAEARDRALEVTILAVPDGEGAKTAEVAHECWEVLGEEGFTRSDAVVTLGGGATTDLGGFVAATWLRGVRVVHVPTTLLAMVDAAVGGKTGIDTGAGKNLVGAFHEPAGVVCDLDLLATLPPAELVAGLGEVVKCGFVADPEILRLVEQHVDGPDAEALTPGSPVLRELVERAVRVKAEVVREDLRETGGRDGHPGREVLNYGHTLGHAIERFEHYGVRHGEAVALGCVFVAELAARAVGLDPAVVERHRTVLDRVGLPTTYDAAPFDELLAAMRVDKKARGAVLRFVVLADLARPTVLAGPDESDLRAAYAALAPRGAA